MRRGVSEGPADRLPEPVRGVADSEIVPGWLVRVGSIGLRLLIVAALVYVVAWLAVKLTLLVVAVAVGLLIAGVFMPLVERAPGPRWWSSLAIVLGVLALLVAAAFFLGQRIAEQLPELRDQLGNAIDSVSQAVGFEIPVPSALSGDGGGDGGDGSVAGATEIIGFASSTFELLVGVFLAAALGFLFLKDGPRIWAWVLARTDDRLRDDVDAGGTAAWRTTSAYVRGLTVVAAFDAVGVGLGLLILGVPLVLTLAALQFLFSYVPTFGALLAGALAVAVAFVSNGLTTAIIVLVIVVVVQQVGNDVIEPWIMGRSLRLHPAVVLVAVTAGGLLWGIAGALLFVPLVAAASAATRAVWLRHHPRRAEARDAA